MATAISRIVRRKRTRRVRRETTGIVENRATVAVEMSWMRR